MAQKSEKSPRGRGEGRASTLPQLRLKIENFGAITKADLSTGTELTFIIAPNRGGKTQLLSLLYSFFWGIWRRYMGNFKEKFLSVNFGERDLLQWGKEKGKVKIFFRGGVWSIYFERKEIAFLRDKQARRLERKEKLFLKRAPIYLNTAGLGDYYKGIYALRKFYPDWHLVPEGSVDLIDDLLIVGGEEVTPSEENRKLLALFEELFESQFSISNRKIYISERGHKFGIERTASGLKSLGWFYLILRYNLIGEVLLIDEPEVNLHPVYLDRLALFLYHLSKNRRVIVATHSDYLLESFNKLLVKEGGEVTVWEGAEKEGGIVYRSYRANPDNLIDTTPLTEVFLGILREGLGYE
jgi:hypothetical protein